MKSSSIITVITYTMALMGLLSASLVRELGLGFLITSTVIVALSLALRIRKKAEAFSSTKYKPLWNIAAIALFLFFTLDYLLFSHDLMSSAIRFLTILAAIKLLDLTSARDYLIFYSLVFFQIIAAAASTVSPIFLLIISVFIICAIWAMIIFNIKSEFESHYPDKRSLPPDLFSPAFFAATVALTTCAIIITLTLFFIIPRVGIGLLESKNLTGLKVSGFSDKINLGDFAPLKKDRAIVMRVGFPQDIPPVSALYFRGQTLDSYNAFGWEATTRKKRRLWKRSNNRFVIGHVKEAGSSMVVQNIMLEPLETDVIFGASRVMMIEGRFPTLWTNESGAVYLPNTPYTRIEYTAVSSINTRVREAANEEIDYLSTIELSSEVIELAGSITKNSTSDLEKAQRIKKYLLENYSYTLSPGKGKGLSPLDDFLFFTKEGYCEHFATAYVMLLRSAGIEARIVTGFLQGEWNEYGGYLLIRQQDAHSWTEANIDGWWTRFDATPSAGLTGLTQTSAFNMYLDSLKFKWRRYILKYSLLDQFRAARSIENQTNRMGRAIMDIFSSVKDVLSGKKNFSLRSIPHSSSVLTLILLIIILLLFRKIKRKSRESNGAKKTPLFYLKMEISLKKAGLVRESSETPLEFALRSENRNVLDITKAFEEVRYGHRELTMREIEEVETNLKNIKSSVKRSAQV